MKINKPIPVTIEHTSVFVNVKIPFNVIGLTGIAMYQIILSDKYKIEWEFVDVEELKFHGNEITSVLSDRNQWEESFKTLMGKSHYDIIHDEVLPLLTKEKIKTLLTKTYSEEFVSYFNFTNVDRE